MYIIELLLICDVHLLLFCFIIHQPNLLLDLCQHLLSIIFKIFLLLLNLNFLIFQYFLHLTYLLPLRLSLDSFLFSKLGHLLISILFLLFHLLNSQIEYRNLLCDKILFLADEPFFVFHLSSVVLHLTGPILNLFPLLIKLLDLLLNPFLLLLEILLQLFFLGLHLFFYESFYVVFGENLLLCSTIVLHLITEPERCTGIHVHCFVHNLRTIVNRGLNLG